MYSVEKNVKPLKNILTLNKIEIVPTTVISGLLNILEPFSITFVLLTIEMLGYLPCYPAEKKKIEPCPKHIRKCNGFNGCNGNCIVLMETIMVSLLECDGFYWWDVKSYWKNGQNTLQKYIL